MKVLHVIPAVAARYGGPSEAVVAMCRALMERGVETRIVTTDADGPAGSLGVECDSEIDWRGVPTRVFPRQRGEGLKYSPALSRWLDRHVGDFDFVHVHAVFSHSSIVAGRACRRAQVPYAVRPLGTLEPWSLRQKPLRKRLFLALSGRRLLEGAHVLHYTTARERDSTEQHLRLRRGIVVPLGVTVAPRTTSVDSAEGQEAPCPYLLSLGRLHPKKGLESLIRVFGALIRQPGYRRWSLVIAGDGDPAYRTQLIDLARREADGRILFPGWVEGTAKWGLLSGAGLGVFPSLQENFGLGVAECLAVGVPVVVTEAVGLAPEVLERSAGWVVADSESRLEEVLAEAIDAMSGPQADELRQRARALGSEYTWSTTAERLHELYSEAAHRERRSSPAWMPA